MLPVLQCPIRECNVCVSGEGIECAAGGREGCFLSFSVPYTSAMSVCQVKELNAQLEEEKRQQLEQAQRAGHSGGTIGLRDGRDNWTDTEIQMLIKAVNLFPAGTSSRLHAFRCLEHDGFHIIMIF